MTAIAFIVGSALAGIAGFAFGIFFERDRHVCRLPRADISEALRRGRR